jgi:plasmid stabilization system protein ParE
LKHILVLPDAAEDIETARDFYANQTPEVGEYLVDSLLSDIVSLERYSGIHSVHFGFHRMLGSRFPFGIYYREFENQIQVFAILDLRRNPNWIRKELSNR